LEEKTMKTTFGWDAERALQSLDAWAEHAETSAKRERDAEEALAHKNRADNFRHVAGHVRAELARLRRIEEAAAHILEMRRLEYLDSDGGEAWDRLARTVHGGKE
jgi:hypothetical protein